MRMLWWHLRNSPIRWTLPVLVVVDLAMLFLRNRHWVGVWPETGAAGQVTVYFLGALTAGAAAWAAAAPSRHHLREQLAVTRVHPAVPEAYRLGATLLILLTPYLVGQAVAFAVTARTFPPGWQLWLGYFTLGLVAMLLAVGLGWTFGRLLGSRFAALFALLSWLAITGVAAPILGSTVVAGGGPPELMVDPTAVVVRLTLVVVLLATLPTLPPIDQLRERLRSTLVPATAAVALAVSMLAAGVIVDRPPPGEDAICVEGRTVLCIWPEHQKYLPMIQDVGARVDALPDEFVTPPLVNQSGLERVRRTDRWGNIEFLLDEEEHAPYFYLQEGSPWSVAGGVAKAITRLTWSGDNCDVFANRENLTEDDWQRIRAFDAWLEAYLAGSHTPDYSTNAPLQAQQDWAVGHEVARTLPTADQLEWAAQEIVEIRGAHCQTAG